MVNQSAMFKAKHRNHRGAPDPRKIKAALSSMPKPVHPKKGPAGPSTSGNQGASSGTPAVEIQFAQKLASNDPVMRSRAVKKLKSWIQARSSDSSQEAFSEMEMMRIWKGLYYCFWMSDKPLVQEELAESIGSMMNCFGTNESSALLFVSTFLVTLGREWVGIDRWRMDKFMMLIRRVLRHCFVFLARFEWRDDLVKKWSEIVETKLISANSLAQQKRKKKKRKFNNEDKPVDQPPSEFPIFHRVALGLQLHFVDVFLEEAAKIGGDDLPAETIQLLLIPFINELARGQEDRLSQHIEERIFQHLMRQSDFGIAYEEGLDGGEEDESIDGDEDAEGGEEEEEVESIDGGDSSDADETMEGDQDSSMFDDTAKDPRAGKVDVVLPQLEPDFEKIADDLFKAGSNPSVALPQRDRLYRLTKQFKALAAGSYPLAMDVDVDVDDLPKIKFAKEVKKAVREEFRMREKIKQEKKKFKMDLKKKSAKDDEGKDSGVEMSNEKKQKKTSKEGSSKDEGGEQNIVKKKKDKKKIEADSPNKKNESKVKKEKKDKKKDISETSVTEDSETNVETKKKQKKRKNKIEETVSQNGTTGDEPLSDSAKSGKKKNKKKKLEGNDQPTSPLILTLPTPQQPKTTSPKKESETSDQESASDSLMLNLSLDSSIKKKKKNKKSKVDDDEQVISISSSKKRKLVQDSNVTPNQKPKISKLITQSLPSKAALQKKRINFSLLENKCSSLQEIDRSILESPDIPFNADKKPKQGVLKKTPHTASAPNTPASPKAEKQSVAYNTLLNGRSTFKRRARMNFF